MSRRSAVVAGIILATFSLTACGHDGHSSGSHLQGAVGAPSAAASAPATNSPALAPALVQTVQLTVETPDVTARAAQASRIAEAAGGAVTGQVSTGSGDTGADLTITVPPTSLSAVVRQLSALGHETARQTDTQDVTADVADVTSRVGSAQASIAQLRSLYDKATNVTDVLAIENQLSQREADLESLEAQQRSLAAETGNATITLQLRTAQTSTATHHGFGGNLTRGWHGLLDSLGWLVAALGLVLPFLLILVVLLGAGRWLQLRARRHRTAS